MLGHDASWGDKCCSRIVLKHPFGGLGIFKQAFACVPPKHYLWTQQQTNCYNMRTFEKFMGCGTAGLV